MSFRALIGFVACLWFAGHAIAAPAQAPARIQNGGIKEGDLATITLTEQAEKRLGIETSPAVLGRAARSRVFAGDVLLPPGRSQMVASPVAGTLAAEEIMPVVGSVVARGQALFRVFPMVAAQRDSLKTAETEVTATKSRLDTARQRLARAEQMLKDQVGSARAVEEARNEVAQSEAAFEAARYRMARIEKAPLDADVSLAVNAPAGGILRQLAAAPGQQVSAGAPLFEIADYSILWLRVPVYSGELPEIDARAAARVESLGAGRLAARTAPPVAAPPTADAQAATVDLYFELRNKDGLWHPGERLSVTLGLRGTEQALQIPRAAVLYDYQGGTWVYENAAPRVFTRRRVQIRRIQGETALLERGLKPGAKVVTAGAAELFGTEFGAGK